MLKATRRIFELAVGNSHIVSVNKVPQIDFGSPTRSAEYDHTAVPMELQSSARKLLRVAYRWCNDRLPLIVVAADNVCVPAIRCIRVSMTVNNVLLSASSPDAPGQMLLGAPWPVKHPYRIASLMAHEAVHQALFCREWQMSPVRPGSLAFSPWRLTARPGRLVCHAFWTFACQCALLSEALVDTPRMIEDSKLTAFVAEMTARVETCLASVQMFEVVTKEELSRCSQGAACVAEAVSAAAAVWDFRSELEIQRVAAGSEFREWAESFPRS